MESARISRIFWHASQFSQLKMEDFLTMRLYQNNDTANVLWEASDANLIIHAYNSNSDTSTNFDGHKPWSFNPSLNDPDRRDSKPGRHLPVFYKDVINQQCEFLNYWVELEVNLNRPPLQGEVPVWTKVDGPRSGFVSPNIWKMKFHSPTEGGVYKIQLDFGMDTPSEVNIVLPLAGAEVKDVVKADIVRSDIFAAKVKQRYNFIQRQLPGNLFRWFWVSGAGDYLGRADNTDSKTVWMYNEIANSGLGSVYTWEGFPIRSAKVSNFMVAVGMRKIGVVEPLGVLANLFGTWPQDGAASLSWEIGWNVGGGGNYDEIVPNSMQEMFWKSDVKAQKLWPNRKKSDNYQDADAWHFDINHHFTSPGFLYMENP